MKLDAFHEFPMSGAFGLRTVAVGVQLGHMRRIRMADISDLS